MRILTTLLLAAAIFQSAQAAIFDVRTEGAKGDGKTLDSPAINKTIEKCAAQGGGIVTLPAGKYLCGSIRMKSNVELNIQAGADIEHALVGIRLAALQSDGVYQVGLTTT